MKRHARGRPVEYQWKWCWFIQTSRDAQGMMHARCRYAGQVSWCSTGITSWNNQLHGGTSAAAGCVCSPLLALLLCGMKCAGGARMFEARAVSAELSCWQDDMSFCWDGSLLLGIEKKINERSKVKKGRPCSEGSLYQYYFVYGQHDVKPRDRSSSDWVWCWAWMMYWRFIVSRMTGYTLSRVIFKNTWPAVVQLSNLSCHQLRNKTPPWLTNQPSNQLLKTFDLGHHLQ